MSNFGGVPLLPPDQIFGVVFEFAEDKREDKLNLCIGVYRSEDGKPFIFDAVKQVEARFLQIEDSKEYLPIRGEGKYCELTAELAYGKDGYAEAKNQLYVNQTPGGTGALRAAAELLKEQIQSTIHLPDPTWVNHAPIFQKVGLTVERYPYFHGEKRRVDVEKMVDALKKLPEQAVVLFHAACHNPSGCDPSEEEWKEIVEVVKQRKILPLVDFAYQGFGEGLEKDNVLLRILLEKQVEHMVAYSFSKNLGMYGERTGALFVYTDNKDLVEPVGSYVRSLVRTNYSNCPRHGATLVRTVLGDKELRSTWEQELESIRLRIVNLRERLQKRMQEELPDRDWSFFTRQKGMFSMCGFPKEIVHRLKSEFAIYMTESARINIAALNDQSIEYFIDSLKKAHS